VIPFLGKFIHAVDEKGRTNVPSKFRDILKHEKTQHLILIKGLDGCLFLLPLAGWTRFEERLEQEHFQSDAEARHFERELLDEGDVLIPDAQGRIQIPKELRAFAHIDAQALFLGMRNRIEVWSADVYASYKENARRQSSKTLEELASSYWRRRT